MVSIYVCGEDKTRQISGWDIKPDGKGEFTLTCYYPSQKTYSRPLGDCRVVPTLELKDMLLLRKGSSEFNPVARVEIYGEKHALVQYPGKSKKYIFNMDSVEFFSPTSITDEPAFTYFRSVATARVSAAAAGDKKGMAENIDRQMGTLSLSPATALHAYCKGQHGKLESSGNFIFPFGLNESQLRAVEQAFLSQVSVIEGPPGTGKTQTILNIIANILLQGKTVAVVSNNNSAVENVYEKLGKCGLDYLVARLGKNDNQKEFFANRPSRPSTDPSPAPAIEHIQAVLQQLKGYLGARNAVAQLQIEISELEIERRYLTEWQRDNGVAGPSLDRYKLSPQKTTDLMAYLEQLASERIRIKDRIELLFNFRILRTRPFDNWDKRMSAFYSLQLHYYDKVLQDKKTELAAHEEALRLGNFKALLEELTTSSMLHLKHHLHRHIPDDDTFDTTYRKRLDAFLKRYPVIGSSTHSIVNSLGGKAVLDYVIIDEASQQDIVPGVLALSCAKNLIIVGDRKQLAHIPEKLGLEAPAPWYDCEKYSLLDSCVSVFGNSIPMTLLKEHYRCHPRIIQFCNQQFYDSQLVPMTMDNGEKPLTLLVTAKGNHTRNNSNLRELDSLLAVLEADGESLWEGEDGRGFIAPFKNQAMLSGSCLPADFVRATVHKFQGRECDEIVFSTVLDKYKSPERLSFVDDARMVNVAVSRAKSRFTLVTGDNVFKTSNGHIAALIRYMEYYADDGQVHRAPVISAFDLLYKEYDRSLERLNKRLNPDDSLFKSEQIVAQILREALVQEPRRGIMFHREIRLMQLAAVARASFTERELEFMRNAARCDFVLYFKVGKTPLGVIEVDGGHHDDPLQIERDAVKNSILNKCGIPLLRLRTIESRIEEKVAAFLDQWTPPARDESRRVSPG
ncbi:helicase [Pseudomonas amygdali pv. tabaci str. ATCC 11528]|uniref:AAA domain-containing protein n=1 Tax=Pseudomonas amygdali TaxID=47877 RepID=UPI0001BC8A94|nr:AAA domain-containing protein [Pseudomonas amygdali]KEZ64244.1 helicase [Pseudomonas amygdali pv. tabaci str. ATCC 11528]KKY54923.1 helicase [Pseudomonas amygdali pv. tabaci str. ATCC 11528]